jgi:hypothetical protein
MITAELKSVHETEPLALSTVKKWYKRFAEGRTSLCNDSKCGRPLTNVLAEAISSVLKERSCFSCKVLCRHFRIVKGTCSQILYDTLGLKSSIFVGFPMPWTRIRRPKESLYHMEFFRYYRVFVLLVSRVWLLEISRGSFHSIPVIRYGRCHEMKCQNESVKKWHRKVSNFTFLVYQWNLQPCWCFERQHV